MIRAVRLLDHHWTLATQARAAVGTWTTRRALLLVVEDSAGHVGIGEAAPLPGYSRDTFDEAHQSLRGLLGLELPARDPGLTCGDALGRASAHLQSPSARTALEAALLDLWSRSAGVPAWALLGSGVASERVPVAAWLPDGPEAAVAAAKSAFERGVRAFKVKLDATRGLLDGVMTLVALRHALGADVQLRADANRSATVAELEPHLPRLRHVRLEWFEEPTREPLSKSFGVPVALDESLGDSAQLPSLESQPDVVALVLKPTALGGLSRCLELSAHAARHGRLSVASHALEGPAGFMAAAALALALPQGAAHGLGPHGRVKGNARLAALSVERDELLRWDTPGFGLSQDDALAGAQLTASEDA